MALSCSLCRRALAELLDPAKPRNRIVSHQSNFQTLAASARQGCKVCECFSNAALEAPRHDPRPPEYRWQPETDEASGFVLMANFQDTDPIIGSGQAVCQQFNLALNSDENMGANVSFHVKGDHPSLPVRDVSPHADFELASKWIKQCSHSHQKCPDPQDVELPTRLIDVGQAGQDPRLVETRGQRGSQQHSPTTLY